MRRFIISTGALVALGCAATALAANLANFNTYNAHETFAPGAAGSPAHPVPGSIHELWTANGTNGNKAGPLIKIVAKMYGIKTNGSKFPVCTAKMINSAGNARGWNKVCPKHSLIAQGPVKSLFVPNNTPTAPGSACDPYLTIYNAGPHTQAFFFETYPQAPGRQYSCLQGGVHTGAAPAYTGTITEPSSSNHDTYTLNLPLPPTVSTTPGGLRGVYASLLKLNVTYAKLTRKVHGKTVAYGESIGCKHGKRPYSFQFTAQNYKGRSPHTQTTTISHVATCT